MLYESAHSNHATAPNRDAFTDNCTTADEGTITNHNVTIDHRRR